MQNALDIYTRLIIAIITFVVPFIIFSLTNYGKILQDKLTEWESKEMELLNEADMEMGGENKGDTKSKIQKSAQYSEKLKKIEKERDQELNSINPKIQFVWIFSALSLSLILIIIDYLVRDGVLTYFHELSVCLIVLSLITFAIAIYRIVRVIFKLISIIAKRDEK